MMNNKNIVFTVLWFLLTLTFQVIADDPDAGAIAPDFEITQLDGKTFHLSDYKGKQSVYLVFWNTWCSYCMKKIPKLKKAQSILSKDIKVIAINTSNNDSLEETKAFQKRFNINYPLAFDHRKKVTDLYNVWGTPTEFIIDINGVIQHRDGVPDKLEDYLATWNKKTETISQILINYYNIVSTVLIDSNKTS